MVYSSILLLDIRNVDVKKIKIPPNDNKCISISHNESENAYHVTAIYIYSVTRMLLYLEL